LTVDSENLAAECGAEHRAVLDDPAMLVVKHGEVPVGLRSG
jgi:hypothetical protein